MAPKRKVDGETAGGRLALFLVDLTDGLSVHKLAEMFEPSSSSWGNYLNGSQLIPKEHLGPLLESFTKPGPVRQAKVLRAWELWKEADTERRGAHGTALVRQHQRRDDALQQVIELKGKVAKAQSQIDQLNIMHAYTKSRLENAELQLKLGNERERGRMERQMGQARERLGRVRVQQERARHRRMTAEELEQYWLAEALLADEEIRRLEEEARDLVVIPPQTVALVSREAPDDSVFDDELERIAAEGLEDDALLEEERLRAAPAEEDESDAHLVVQAVQVVQDGVQPLSNIALDKPPTSTDTERRTALTLVARTLDAAGPARLATALHAAGPARLAPAQRAGTPPKSSTTRPRQELTWLGLFQRLGLVAVASKTTSGSTTAVVREPASETLSFWAKGSYKPLAFVLGLALLSVVGLWYFTGQAHAAQGSDVSDRIGAAFTTTLLCLVPLYWAFRLMAVPKLPARILAFVWHLAWILLMLFNLFPWPAAQSLTE
ncbi:hypothetical protein [Streptomyces sp. NPDC097619]|uniref:hypothetical protein n=1 Tax=Streptomyces sp. NPDC097619 TaxID=3157228 RepID=UPI003332F251